MRTIRDLDSLRARLRANDVGVLADTGFLYAASDIDDRLSEKAFEIFEILEDLDVPVYLNVIGRMELVDLVLRKQLTGGAISTYEDVRSEIVDRSFSNLLKSIRDENTAHARSGQSYKIGEGKLKKLRAYFDEEATFAWRTFCRQYAGDKLSNEWRILEEEFGLKFIEVLEGQTSHVVNKPLYWKDMIRMMGQEGLRGSDAMIANVFLKSRLPVLITTDGDIAKSFTDYDLDHESKIVFHLEH